jgi:hypothetical protein
MHDENGEVATKTEEIDLEIVEIEEQDMAWTLDEV